MMLEGGSSATVVMAGKVKVTMVYNPIDPDSPRSGGAYQMNTGDGRLEVIALAINTGGDRLYYSVIPSFIHIYGGILPLGNIIKWNLKKCFVAWMESIINSFLHHRLEGQLNEVFQENPTQQLNIRVGNFAWVVPIDNGHLHYPTLEQFIEILDLGTLDYLFVTASGEMELTIIVFDYYYVEKIYDWF
ncbi:hypothetical protein RHGRI_031454 [Rhododendron griersonianum]|uniref:Uncharacterized protein n=1 Tax=Rhododendron griersonianum TaxID=479676 RepID=A0AAV6I8R0_9ERIC|nr:hypothetical protein RHGRI_031454 [Rhododendron griersonianum]